MDSALPCCTGAASTRPLMPGQNLTAARSLLKLAVHSASSAPTINVQKVSALLSAFAFVAHFDKNAVKVQALIRKEFERNKNETRPEVVEVCLAPSAPTHLPNRAFQVFTCLCQSLKSNAAAALTHYLFYASSPPIPTSLTSFPVRNFLIFV